jgi:murein DD-endopeptidase MepM/ murein hydrolase activator NlpD
MSEQFRIRSWWLALALAASASGCAAEVSESELDAEEASGPGDVGLSAEALHTCGSWTATRSSHISARRARWVGTRVLAVGSDQQLTSSSTQVMSEPSPGYFVVGACPTQLYFQFPMGGSASRDWVIHYYTNLANDGTTLRDYRGGTRTKYDAGGAPHSGTDVTIANFRKQDAGVDVFAAEDGTVIEVQNANPDRNTSCGANPNLVRIRHRTGASTLYLHLRAGSIPVRTGDFVRRGAKIGQVGSSGCSFWPHLHFEVREFNGTVICPFRDNMWVRMPAYDSPLDLMDFALISGDHSSPPNSVADPGANMTKVFTLGAYTATVYTGNGLTGEVVQLDILDEGGTMIDTMWRTATTGEQFVIRSWMPGINAGQLPGLKAGNFTFRARIGVTTRATANLRVAPGGLFYQAHLAGAGWQAATFNGRTAGRDTGGVNIEAMKMQITGARATAVCYTANVQNVGWLAEVCGPTEMGTPGGGNGIEALRVRLTGAQAGCSVRYRALVRGIGWTNYVYDNADAGTTGQNRQLDAVRIELTEGCVP